MKSNCVFKTLIIVVALLSLVACKKDEVDPPSGKEKMKTVTFHFKAKANQMSDFMNGMIMFQNAHGDQFGVTKLRYLVSGIVLHKTDGTEYKIEGHHFVDISESNTLSFTPSEKISGGSYDQISMVFGLTPENNKSFSHPDLNLLSWNWPEMIGGGYHFMQLEGDYIDNNSDTSSYQTHLGAAVDPNNTSDTLNNDIQLVMQKDFTVSSGASSVNIDIEMNIDGWYETPNTIDLNLYGASIMMNYDAQMLFHENGEHGVFSIGNVNSN